MFEWIEFIVCFGEHLSPDEIKDVSRNGELVYARQLIFYFARKYKCGTQAWIGGQYGKDHATIDHSVKAINNYIDTDKARKVRIEYYDGLIKRLPSINQIDTLLGKLTKQIYELETKCIGLTLNIATLKNEISKINEFKTTV